jgi:hypothetical protein
LFVAALICLNVNEPVFNSRPFKSVGEANLFQKRIRFLELISLLSLSLSLDFSLSISFAIAAFFFQFQLYRFDYIYIWFYKVDMEKSYAEIGK